MPDVAALVSLAVIRLLGGGGRSSNGQFDWCVCGRSSATLLQLRPADMVALMVRQWLSGDGQAPMADGLWCICHSSGAVLQKMVQTS